MLKKLAKILPLIILCIGHNAFGQNVQKISRAGSDMLVLKSGDAIVCEAGSEDMPIIPLPEEIKSRMNARIKTSEFDVSYFGFTEEAKTAFQYAVDIWAATFSSPVPVNIKATYRVFQEQGTLGQSAFSSPFANFKNAPKRNTWYQPPIAEKIAGEDLNGPGIFDIDIEFNSSVDWYFNISSPDSIVGSGKTDFATVVLHELAHSLGFSGFVRVDENPPGTFSGEINLCSPCYPMAYSTFLHTGTGLNLVNNVPNGGSEMASAFTTNGLRFIGPTSSVRVYAPAEFNGGSSVSHIDQMPNELMNPSLGPNGYIHNPGRALNMMNDYGWEFTYMFHDPLPSTENFNQSFDIVAEVFSDIGYDTTSLQMHYSLDAFQTDTVKLDMVPTGETNMFTATIPNPGEGVIYSYYLTVIDDDERIINNPGVFADGDLSYFQFVAAIDESEPEISHTPLDFLLPASSELKISASITDFFTGVDTAYVQWFINDVEQEAVGMVQNQIFTAGWDATITFDSEFNIGDIITYQIVAVDNAISPLMAVAPNQGEFFTIPIEGIPEPTDEYANDFDSPGTDFLGENFSIETPSGFSTGALHSSHPYEEAGEGNEINYITQLRVPIVIDANNPVMEFDEVVLVEPGEPGTLFGQEEFWDYVIVEGSSDEGANWEALIPGYDSRAESTWLDRYNGGLSGGISSALGDPDLFKKRTIDLTSSGAFDAGQTILIRFRLYSDPFAVGWGWVIDNLKIQGEPTVTSITDYLETEDSFNIYPNPSVTGLFNLSAKFSQNVPQIMVKVMDSMGRIVEIHEVTATGQLLNHTLDLRDQPPGLYLINTAIGNDQMSRKVIKSN